MTEREKKVIRYIAAQEMPFIGFQADMTDEDYLKVMKKFDIHFETMNGMKFVCFIDNEMNMRSIAL